MVIMPSNHLIFCCPLILPSIFPSIRVFPNEFTFCPILHAKMGSINDRNGRDLTEAEEIKKRWKIIEWERLEISPRKLEIPKKHFMQNGHNKEMACT